MSDREALLTDSYEDVGEIKSLLVTVNGRDPQVKCPYGNWESGLENKNQKSPSQ